MGEISEEVTGKAKRLAGMLTGNDELRAEGREQDEAALEQDRINTVEQAGTLTDSNGNRPYAWDSQPARPDEDRPLETE